MVDRLDVESSDEEDEDEDFMVGTCRGRMAELTIVVCDEDGAVLPGLRARFGASRPF